MLSIFAVSLNKLARKEIKISIEKKKKTDISKNKVSNKYCRLFFKNDKFINSDEHFMYCR